MRIRKSLYFIGLLILLPLASHTQELNVQAGPELFLPVGASSSFYSAGAGGAVSTQLELLGFLSPTLETGVTAQVLPGLGDAVAFSRIGGGVDFFLYPISRLRLSAGGRAGAYIFSYNNSALGYYWDVHAQAGFRFSPAFTLNAGAGYRQYRVTPGNADETETAADSDPFDPLVLSGISVTIGAKIQLSSLGNRSSGVTIENINQTPVFPIIYSLYDSTPLGSVTLINQEQAEIRNVKVELSAGSYTSREIVCGEFPILRKGESAEVPLYALFNEGVLAFTENTKLQADLTVKYDLLNAPQEKVLPVTISLKNRNAATWADDRIVAAFISPNDPVVLEYSKFVAGLVREHIRPGINANLQYGIGLFEGLRLSDVSFTPDPSTPYQTTRTDSSLTDYIQYPYQTIAYKGGDRDDLGILYARCTGIGRNPRGNHSRRIRISRCRLSRDE